MQFSYNFEIVSISLLPNRLLLLSSFLIDFSRVLQLHLHCFLIGSLFFRSSGHSTFQPVSFTKNMCFDFLVCVIQPAGSSYYHYRFEARVRDDAQRLS